MKEKFRCTNPACAKEDKTGIVMTLDQESIMDEKKLKPIGFVSSPVADKVDEGRGKINYQKKAPEPQTPKFENNAAGWHFFPAG